MNKVELRARGHGKSYAQFVEFITAVKSGKKAIVVAKDYVVIDSCAYEQLRIENDLKETRINNFKETVKELRKENKELKEKQLLRAYDTNFVSPEAKAEISRLRKALEEIKAEISKLQNKTIRKEQV